MRIKLYDIFEKDVDFDIISGLWNEVPLKFSLDDVDENSRPLNYIQLRYDTTNTTFVFGDGLTQMRQSDCDIMIVTAGAFEPIIDILDRKIQDLLNKNEIPFTSVNLGVQQIGNALQTQITYSVVIYGK